MRAKSIIEMPEAGAMIVYSCAGRPVSMGPAMGGGSESGRKVWDLPIAGMFSNAALVRATNGNLEMNKLSIGCMAIKEK